MRCETIPAFWVNENDEILDITYMTMQEAYPGAWNLAEEINHRPPAGTERIIFETPVGCFYLGLLPTRRGEKITLTPSPGGRLPRCERPARLPAALADIRQNE